VRRRQLPVGLRGRRDLQRRVRRRLVRPRVPAGRQVSCDGGGCGGEVVAEAGGEVVAEAGGESVEGAHDSDDHDSDGDHDSDDHDSGDDSGDSDDDHDSGDSDDDHGCDKD
jgi:hypothetical protein